MKYIKIVAIGSALSWGLSSCVSENQSWEENMTEKGSMSINVDMLRPSSTRAVNTSDFPVKIMNLADDTEFASYEKVSKMPNKILMPVGKYYAKAHTPGELERIMNAPYYSGREEFDILKGKNTETTVTCRMANGSFTIMFSDDFKAAFSEWQITINDGGTTALHYSKDDYGYAPPVKYLEFEENVDKLTVDFKGTSSFGNITTSNNLTKKNADVQYDDDNPYFSGGDAIKLNFSPVESTDGDITGITLKANISFEETSEEYEMEVTDKEQSGGNNNPGDSGDPGDNGGNGDNPGGSETSSITLDLPDDMTVDATTDKDLGNTYIAAEAGIKSITVSIESTSDEMIESLQGLNAEYGVDFVNGAEIVDNLDVKSLFVNNLNQQLSVPSKGDKDYTFPIGNFFQLLAYLSGEHTFNLTVTDMENNTKSGVLILTVE